MLEDSRKNGVEILCSAKAREKRDREKKGLLPPAVLYQTPHYLPLN